MARVMNKLAYVYIYSSHSYYNMHSKAVSSTKAYLFSLIFFSTDDISSSYTHCRYAFIHLMRVASVCLYTFLWQLNCVLTQLFTYLQFTFVLLSVLLCIHCVCTPDFCFHSFHSVYSSDKWKYLVAVFVMATQQLKFITIHFILFHLFLQKRFFAATFRVCIIYIQHTHTHTHRQ